MLLSAEHLSINFGSRQLLDDVNFYLNEGDKVGVIGINGTGKSTFLKVLSGVTEPDGGTISRNPNVQISLLSQNPVMDEGATVLEQVFLHFPAEFRELNEYEAKAMLNRLGITDFSQKVGTLSGGQRKRVALAAALIHPADVLILDEPTNHLDSEMVAWLEDWLRRFKGGLVMVTHDRYFLERVVNHITELSRGSCTTTRPTTPSTWSCGSSGRKWRRPVSASASPSSGWSGSGSCGAAEPGPPSPRSGSSGMRPC